MMVGLWGWGMWGEEYVLPSQSAASPPTDSQPTLVGLPQTQQRRRQIMPCGLEDRARFFPRLDSLRQKTPGFFDAPAAGLAPLGIGRLCRGQPLDMEVFPETAIVFCTIDKCAAAGFALGRLLGWAGMGISSILHIARAATALTLKHPPPQPPTPPHPPTAPQPHNRFADMLLQNQAVAEEALAMYSDAVRWLLLVAGGYECQEAEGTFMVAFASADAAIEWSLMVQIVLRDLNWPERWVPLGC